MSDTTRPDPDHIPRPVVGLSIEFAGEVGETAPHAHRKAQLLWVRKGALTVEAGSGIWTVPPNCAIWIPGGAMHTARDSGPVSVGCLYVEPGITTGSRAECGIVFIQPLLRELLSRFITTPHLYPQGDTRETRLVSVLLDELQAAPEEPLHLPMPVDRRLLRLVEALIEDPSLRFSLGEWGARVGASNRTLTRLFQSETGLSFGQWRQQLHVSMALRRLASGDSVTTIALDLGYESISAFIAMFKRMLGTTPSRYFDDIAGADKAVETDDADSSASKIVKLRLSRQD
ncbi:helix-turn-helix transcriptional regulator [Bradyrhizobium prioriisuperbiae]|uniref:AraC family transcriptional regulator n=1 Tax=Bradyrhizobium prioriisuperbiae TaxID=2854389 RepID=UPI0028F0E423|nr:helix-turn-helix transcriptional regulator [Bradyrhizobium prioritasuperba]